ncbi:MAG TPA: CHAT domain-containing tetratricopeptide repeat protein [Thermoanaerobaculia bacterium]|jgi:CHAT domain-containing protein/tetratricopeptide (TPR) repeat protein|nr:CHAT domain-containing tetratricopeptide repeat protein [Thermoanaerobaculia bacterium]
MKRPALALVLLAILLPGAPATPKPAAEPGETLLPGPARERPIAAGESHVYQVEVTGAPLLVSVLQQGIDLVVEARGTAEPKALTSDAFNGRWGPEILLLRARGADRIEVRPGGKSVPPGRYTIEIEALSTATAEGERRAAAFQAMSRAIQLPFGTPEERRQALAAYREALGAWRSLGERRWEAEAVQAIAALERQSDELPAARADYEKALELWREIAEPSREAEALRWLGTIHGQTGENAAARAALVASSALWQGLGEPFEEGMVKAELCFLEHTTGNPTLALTCYEEVRALFRVAGDSSQEPRMLNNLGGVYDLLGEPDAALEKYGQALALRQALGNRLEEAQTLNNIAQIHQVLGDWQEALRIYARVGEILPPSGDRLRASWLNNVAFTYIALGEPERALSILEEALRLRRQIGARREELITLNNLGEAWHRLGEPEKALNYYRQALELARTQEDHRQEAITRLRLGELLLEGSDPSAALREIDPALQYLREKGPLPGELHALQLQGRALVLAGRSREALPVLEGALIRRQALGDRAGVADTLHILATAERSMGAVESARAHAEAAVAQVEELRTGFLSLGLRAAFLESRRRAYSLLIDLEMDRHAADPGGGHDRAALAISEQARARSLLDALYAGNAGGAVPADLLARRQSLHRRLSAKADQQQKQTGRAEALKQEIAALLVELDHVEAEIRRHDPRYAALSQPQPVGLAGIAGLLDPGTLLLEYSLGEERSYLWAVSAEGLQSFVLPPQRAIEDLARQVYEELRTVEAGIRRRPGTAADLSRVLLGPVWGRAARLRRLVVVPDGALHALPFGALPVPEPGEGWQAPGGLRPLLDHLEVVDVPSATTLAVQRQRLQGRPPAAKWAAVLADPVFTAADPRLAGRPAVAKRRPSAATAKALSRGGEELGLLPAHWDRLPASRREAETIARLAPAGQVWTALDFAANRDAVLAGDLRGYRIVHFATHGVADARTPELSGLMLSAVDASGQPRAGFLGLSDIYDLDLGADLVVLSACETGVGKELRGEGLMGLTRGFLYAGVPRVVASLWKVEDRTTAELMARFYRAMWRQGLRPAAALRAAQRGLRRDPRYRAPHSWAGFVLQGDWR